MSRHGIKRKHDEAACDRHSYVHNSGCAVCDTWVNHEVIADYRAKYGTPPRAARIVCAVAHPDAPLTSDCEVPTVVQPRGAVRDMRIPGREGLHTMAAWRAWFYPKPGRLSERGRKKRARRRARAASRRAAMRAIRVLCQRREPPINRPAVEPADIDCPNNGWVAVYAETYDRHGDWTRWQVGTWRAGR